MGGRASERSGHRANNLAPNAGFAAGKGCIRNYGGARLASNTGSAASTPCIRSHETARYRRVGAFSRYIRLVNPGSAPAGHRFMAGFVPKPEKLAARHKDSGHLLGQPFPSTKKRSFRPRTVLGRIVHACLLAWLFRCATPVLRSRPSAFQTTVGVPEILRRFAPQDDV